MDPISAGAVISGGAKILGAFFGGRSQRKAERRAAASALAAEQRNNAREDALYQRDRSTFVSDRDNQFDNLRAAAEKGGFNPASVLGVGPMPQMMGGGGGNAYGTQFTAPLTSISAAFDGVADASAAFTGETAMQYQTYKLQTDLARVQLESVKADLAASVAATRVAAGVARMGRQTRPSAQLANIKVPTTTLDAITPSASGAMINTDDMPPVEAATIVSNEVLDVPRMRIAGVDFRGSGRFSTGQVQEDAIGEGIVSDFIGAPITVGRFIDMVGFTAGSALSSHIDRIRLNNMRRSTPSLTTTPKRAQTEEQRAHMKQNYPTAYDEVRPLQD